MTADRRAGAALRCVLLAMLLAACGPTALPAAQVAAPATPDPPATATVHPTSTLAAPTRAATVVVAAARSQPATPAAPTPGATATASAPTARPVAPTAAPTASPTPVAAASAAVPAAEGPTAVPPPAPAPRSAPKPTAAVACVAPRDAAGLVGRPGCVEGAVTKVTYAANSRGSPTFVDFGDAFTALVWIEDRSQFPDLDGWQGRRLRVRGAVELYRGRPEIVLRSAEQVSQVGR